MKKKGLVGFTPDNKSTSKNLLKKIAEGMTHQIGN